MGREIFTKTSTIRSITVSTGISQVRFNIGYIVERNEKTTWKKSVIISYFDFCGGRNEQKTRQDISLDTQKSTHTLRRSTVIRPRNISMTECAWNDNTRNIIVNGRGEKRARVHTYMGNTFRNVRRGPKENTSELVVLFLRQEGYTSVCPHFVYIYTTL